MINKGVQISLENESVQYNNIRVSDMFGYIDYSYFEKTNMYPDGLLILHGAYIYKEFRQSKRFKIMIKDILKKYPEKTVVQTAIKNKKLVKMFERMNFERVKRIEYWGECSNSILMQGIITKNTIHLI